MKKRSILLSLLGVALLLSLTLMACDGNGDTDISETEAGTEVVPPSTDTDTEEPNGAAQPPADDPVTALVPPHIAEMINRAMPTSEQSSYDVIDGGILRYVVATGTPFGGILHSIWSLSADDSHLQTFFLGSTFTVDDDFLLDPDGTGTAVRTFEISDDGLTITIFLRDGVYWHDGVQHTARDWEFAYEVLAHPESGTTRFGQQNSHRIVGINEFREGEADDIAGIRVIDDLTLEIEFDGVLPIRNTVFTQPLPYHIFRDIPIDEMQDSPYVRTEAAIGFGPFIPAVIVPGESMTFTRNENYYWGAPVLEGVEVRRVAPDLLGAELEAGTVDIATTFAEANFPYFDHLTNITYLKAPGWAYNTITFRVGYFEGDQATGRAALDPDAPMSDVNLRMAMWKSIDTELISDAFFLGLRWDGATIVPPIHRNFHNPNIVRPPYDMDAAHALLDEAGYEWDGDYRTFPEGSPRAGERLELTFTFSSPDNATTEAVQQYHISQWNELGIYLRIRDYDFVAWGQLFTTETDDTDWDVQINAWSFGTNPSPAGFFGPAQGFNRSRYTSERMDALLARIDGEQAAMDPMGYRLDAVWEFQEYLRELAVVVPTQFRFAFVPVNNRVVDFEIVATPAPSRGWHLVGLTHDEPLRHGQ